MRASVRISDNADAFLREIRKERVRTRPRVAVDNDAPYAVHLYRRGMWVTDAETLGRYADAEVRKLLSSAVPITTARLEFALARAARLTIKHFQSFTSEMAPPVRAGGAPRRKHPTGYADRTTVLASSYYYQVGNGPRVRVDYFGAPNL